MSEPAGLPSAWEGSAVLGMEAIDLDAVRELITRGAPAEGLIRQAYLGVLLELLPTLRRWASGAEAVTRAQQLAAAKLLQQVVAAIPAPRVVGDPVERGRGEKRRLSFTVTLEGGPAGALPAGEARRMLESIVAGQMSELSGGPDDVGSEDGRGPGG